jgi:hypothetical protein
MRRLNKSLGKMTSHMPPKITPTVGHNVLDKSLSTGQYLVHPSDLSIFTLVANMARNARGLPPLDRTSPPTEQDVLEAGVRHAIYQFLIAGDVTKVDEVVSTSSLMGFIGANVNIFNLLSAFSKGNQTKLQWSAQRSSGAGVGTEGLSGADFGIILPVKNKGDTYRLAFFQAKRELVDENGVRRLNISQLSGKSDYAQTVATKSDTARAKDSAAQQAPDKIQSTEGSNENKNVLKWLAGKELQGTGKFHQIFKLAHTQKRGHDLANSKPSWVHYVLWPHQLDENSQDSLSLFPPGARPMTVSLETVRAFLGKNLSSFTFTNSGVSSTCFPPIASAKSDSAKNFPDKFLYCDVLDDLICSGINDANPDGWLTVSIDVAQLLVGAIIDAGVKWILWDDKGGGLVTKLADKSIDIAVHETPSTLPHLTVAIEAAFPMGVQTKTPRLKL